MSREEILRRIRAATADITSPPDIPRRYQPAGSPAGRTDDGLADRFAERAGDYRATVRRCRAADAAQVIADAVTARAARRIGVPQGFPAEWSALLPDPVPDEPPLDVAALDSLDGVVTTCAVAIAETGTIVLDGGLRSGRRAITLVPDHHICVVEAEQVVMLVPEAFARVEQAVIDRRAPVTLISGPSATSDIELNRVEGVHGPRTLVVVLAG